MEDHPIQGLMTTAMESIMEMVDVGTVVGEAVECPDGTVIIPVSRVTFGFAAGGGEYGTGNGVGRNREKDRAQEGSGRASLPFGGGSGAGVTIQPVSFLVVKGDNVRLLPADGGTVVNQLIDLAPQVVEQVQELFKRGDQEETDKAGERKV